MILYRRAFDYLGPRDLIFLLMFCLALSIDQLNILLKFGLRKDDVALGKRAEILAYFSLLSRILICFNALNRCILVLS